MTTDHQISDSTRARARRIWECPSSYNSILAALSEERAEENERLTRISCECESAKARAEKTASDIFVKSSPSWVWAYNKILAALTEEQAEANTRFDNLLEVAHYWENEERQRSLECDELREQIHAAAYRHFPASVEQQARKECDEICAPNVQPVADASAMHAELAKVTRERDAFQREAFQAVDAIGKIRRELNQERARADAAEEPKK